MKKRLLIVDDDEGLSVMLAEYLGNHGFEVQAEGGGEKGLARLRRERFDVVVLDVMLPDLDGFEILRHLRAEQDVPVLMLTARGESSDRVVGLELGADDYLSKPFDPRELLARLRALVRRRGESLRSPGVLRVGDVEIDSERRRVRVRGSERELTAHQFDLLKALAENRGRVLSRDELLRRVRGGALSPFDRSIDVHISRIRAAIEENPKRPRLLLTVRGVGYVLAAADD